MQGWPRNDYAFFGGKPPFRRHIENSRREKKEWPAADEPITEEDIARAEAKTGPEIELLLHQRFLTRREVSAVMKAKNKGKKRGQKLEYYDFLEALKTDDCIPAMRAFLAGEHATMRAALLKRLADQGLLEAAHSSDAPPLSPVQQPVV